MKTTRLCISLIVSIVLLGGCSKLRDDYSVTGRVHPEDWLTSHGAAVIPDLTEGNPLTCTGCHGQDLDGGAANVSCKACHLGRTDACIICHGGLDNASGAPPFSLSGDSSRTIPGVGAHTAHLTGGTISAFVACDQCHVVPQFSFSADHLGPDTTAEVIFGSLADLYGGAVYSFNDNSCSDTYCHGNFSGGYQNIPVWTDVSGAQDSCGFCHYVSGPGARDLGGKHKKHVEQAGFSCYECHLATVDQDNNIIGPQAHIDGQNTVLFRLGGSWSDNTCSNLDAGCHGDRRWN